MGDHLEKFIAAGQRRKALINPPKWTPAEHRQALHELFQLVEPCPFCGKPPALAPVEPWEEGNAFGLVECRNGNCAAQPKVSDESNLADERGPAAYIALAIRRWNRRPLGVAPTAPTQPSDAELLHLWDKFVGEPTDKCPLIDKDKTRFARAVLAAHGVDVPVPTLLQCTVLRDVVRCLRETGRYVDEEGEATNALDDLAQTLAAAGVALPATANEAHRLADEFYNGTAEKDWVMWAQEAVVILERAAAAGVGVPLHETFCEPRK